MSRHPGPLAVHGGTGGITANRDDLFELARRFGAAGHDIAARATDVCDTFRDPLLGTPILGSWFDPVDAALEAAEGDVHQAHLQLTFIAGALDDLARKLVDAALGYDRADGHTGGLVHSLDNMFEGLLAADFSFDASLLHTHSPGRAFQEGITTDPEMVDILGASLVPGLVVFDGVAPDGRGAIGTAGVDTYGVAGLPPRNLDDVLGDLAQRTDDGHSGEIDVRILTMPDGERRVVADITGTKSWDPLPTHDVTSLVTNARALDGLPTAYEQGVLAALRRAGVRPTDPVMLVGHSQGGMIAVNAARRAVRSGEFDVTHVITVGSPIGRTAGRLPDHTKLLALENRADVVPHLDGRSNPDRRNVTTVSGNDGDGTIVDDHDITDGYEPIARAVDRSDSRSVVDFLRSARGYFSARSVVTHTYQIVRD